jgi:hypothetical protein
MLRKQEEEAMEFKDSRSLPRMPEGYNAPHSHVGIFKEIVCYSPKLDVRIRTSSCMVTRYKDVSTGSSR